VSLGRAQGFLHNLNARNEAEKGKKGSCDYKTKTGREGHGPRKGAAAGKQARGE